MNLCLIPEIHLYSIPFQLSQDCFLSTHSSRKIRNVIRLRLQSALPPIFNPPTPTPPLQNKLIKSAYQFYFLYCFETPCYTHSLVPRVSFRSPKRGPNVGRPCDLAATLARDSKLESAHVGF
ncbi:hypothetical protein AVEN_271806-1 [Araneus ventricosus]|uniref:Uncharacterized protein n=1 Tax=Araneus ventricosus TaxID=182803 RepID=A0A4Y2T171_ARAVE|nr:hypothetical protein AVEN_271806-1 [Araneus ventricosus]